MNTITQVNMQHYSYQSKTNNFFNNIQNKNNTNSPKFKGYTQIGGEYVKNNKKGIAALISSGLTVIAGLFAKNKKTEEPVKVVEEPQKKKPLFADYKKALEINPELTKALYNITYETMVGKGDYEDRPVYNGTMLLKIAEEYEQNPVSGYELAKFLKHDRGAGGIKESNIDYIISKYNENPKLAYSLKGDNAQDTAVMMHIYYEDPELIQDVKGKDIDTEDLQKILETKRKYPKAIKELLNSDKFKYNELSIVAPVYSENKDSVDHLMNIANENELSLPVIYLQDLVPMYKAEPEKIEKTIIDYKITNPRYVKMFKDTLAADVMEYIEDCKGRLYLENAFEHAVAAHKLAPVLKPLTEGIPSASLRFKIRNEIINELGKELESTMPRMIEDNRIPKTQNELYEVSHLYAKYPKTKITDRMLELNKDSFARCFDISKL